MADLDDLVLTNVNGSVIRVFSLRHFVKKMKMKPEWNLFSLRVVSVCETLLLAFARQLGCSKFSHIHLESFCLSCFQMERFTVSC